MKKLVLIGMCTLLGACASGASTGAMIVPLSQERIVADQSPLRGNISIANVTGGKETNPLWTSEVSNDAFLDALKQSLSVHTLLGNDKAKYRLAAKLVQLKQPFAGFNMTVTAKVQYTLTEVASNKTVFDRTLETPYQAKMGDAFLGAKRLQLANEGAVRTNIQALIDALIAESKSNPALLASRAVLIAQLQAIAASS
jgi:hypothetical protein